jgi:hypothetical protein
MLPGVIGYLAALAMSVVEKRLLKWRSVAIEPALPSHR